ncbi:hypothetical protein HDU67_009095 [Dinochytrium kinnereticum]|nr:hypothetical protein HDU67_009095 [Dinochytrium kinnereticum]
MSLPPTTATSSSDFDHLFTPASTPIESFKIEETARLSSAPGSPNYFTSVTTSLRPRTYSNASSISRKEARSSPYPTNLKKTPSRRGRKLKPAVINPDDNIPPPPPTLPPNTIGFINIVFDPITDDLPEDGVPEFHEVHDEANPQVGENEIHPLRAPLLTGIPVPQPTRIVYTVFPKPTQRMLMDRERHREAKGGK